LLLVSIARSPRQLAGVGVRLTYYGSKTDGRMLKHNIFDWPWIDVVTTTNNEILGAAGNPEVAIFVETA